MKDSKYGLKIFLRKKFQAAFQAIRIIKMNVPTFLHLFQLFASYISNTRFRVKVLPAVSFTRDYRWEDWNLYTFWSLLEVVLVVVSVAHSCLTPGYPMDCSPLGFSVHGILQAKLLEWVAIPFPRRPSQTRDRTWVLPHYGQTLYHLSHQEAQACSFAITFYLWMVWAARMFCILYKNMFFASCLCLEI